MENYIIILTSVLLNAIAQLALKKGMMIMGRLSLSDINYIDFAINVLKNQYLLAGFACYAFSLLAWMMALSRVEVSSAYPFLSIGYIVTLIFGYYLFNESITAWKVGGIFFICCGVLMMAKTV